MKDGQSVRPTGLLCVPTQAVLEGKTIVAVEMLNNATSMPVVHDNVVRTLNFSCACNPQYYVIMHPRDKMISLRIFFHI